MAVHNKATERISLKATPVAKAKIDRAAAISQKGRTEFMLDAALKSADEVIQNQTEFWFDESVWDAFTHELDERDWENDPGHKRLMEVEYTWE